MEHSAAKIPVNICKVLKGMFFVYEFQVTKSIVQIFEK